MKEEPLYTSLQEQLMLMQEATQQVDRICCAPRQSGKAPDVWAIIHQYADERWPRTIETTLLGRVPPDGTIPFEVQQAARQHGMEVLCTDKTHDTYTLRLL